MTWLNPHFQCVT